MVGTLLRSQVVTHITHFIWHDEGWRQGQGSKREWRRRAGMCAGFGARGTDAPGRGGAGGGGGAGGAASSRAAQDQEVQEVSEGPKCTIVDGSRKLFLLVFICSVALAAARVARRTANTVYTRDAHKFIMPRRATAGPRPSARLASLCRVPWLRRCGSCVQLCTRAVPVLRSTDYCLRTAVAFARAYLYSCSARVRTRIISPGPAAQRSARSRSVSGTTDGFADARCVTPL